MKKLLYLVLSFCVIAVLSSCSIEELESGSNLSELQEYEETDDFPPIQPLNGDEKKDEKKKFNKKEDEKD